MIALSASAKALVRIAAVCATTMLAGCGTFYIDNGLPELKPEDRVKVANSQPVQLLVEFQTRGVTNGQGTDEIKPMVVSAVQSSGLFSQVSGDPAPNGSLLHVTLNNVPLTGDENDAYAKGFLTGFTFGLVGTTVGDGYICTITYQAKPGGPELTKEARNVIYGSFGATGSTPERAEKMPNIKTAVETMVRRTVGSALNNLAKDPGFQQ